MILNSLGEPKCVVFLTDTYVRKFSEVSEQHAYEEGEGDRTLAYWRNVHREFFSRYGNFSEEEDLVCERFKVL